MEWLKALDDLRAEIRTAAQGCGRSPAKVLLVAVSKGRSVEDIQGLYEAGQRDFGENRLQELESKWNLLPQDINWHFIGTLQTKKVPKVVGRIALIHSVDSLELAEKISEVSSKRQITSNILLQVNPSNEATKHGFTVERCREQFAELLELPAVKIRGLMTMAPLTEDEGCIKQCFNDLYQLFSELQAKYQPVEFTELSMGMSHDFQLAIAHGATLVRIGSHLFKK